MVITFYTFDGNVTAQGVTRLAHGPIKPQTDKEMTRNDQTTNKNRTVDIRVRLRREQRM